MNPLDQAISDVDVAQQQIGVLAITTQARYSVLLNALKGYGNMDDARYNFAMEASLLADAHKQWKTAADALELLISQDMRVNPETGGHDRPVYVHKDGAPIHPGCVCDGSVKLATRVANGSKPFAVYGPFHSLPFPEPSISDYAKGYTGSGNDE